MKKMYFKIIVGICLIFGFSSCEDTYEEVEMQRKVEIQEESKRTGELTLK